MSNTAEQVVETPIIEDLTAQLIENRNELRELSAQEKVLKKEKEELEIRLRDAMQAVGTDMARANGHTISIQTRIVPTLKDYDTFGEWFAKEIQDHPEYISLFERRISSPVYRELLETMEGEEIPGIEPFEKWSISLRVLSN